MLGRAASRRPAGRQREARAPLDAARKRARLFVASASLPAPLNIAAALHPEAARAILHGRDEVAISGAQSPIRIVWKDLYDKVEGISGCNRIMLNCGSGAY